MWTLFNSIVILQNKNVKTLLEMNTEITLANVEKCSSSQTAQWIYKRPCLFAYVNSAIHAAEGVDGSNAQLHGDVRCAHAAA